MLIDETEFNQVSCMYWYIGNMGNPTLLLNAYCNWTIPSHDSRLVKITEVDHFECHLLLWFPSLFRFFSATCLGGVPSRKKVLRATLDDPWVGRLVSCEKSHLMEKHLNSHCKSSNNAVYLGLRISIPEKKQSADHGSSLAIPLDSLDLQFFLLVGCVLGEEWELQFIHSHSKFNFLQAGEPATWWLQLRLFEASFGLTILAVGRQL